MNIIEAHKSGKHMRPKGREDSPFRLLMYWIKESPNLLCIYMADDWEVEEEKRELSWEEILIAFGKGTKSTYWGAVHKYTETDFDRVKNELGFTK